MSDKEIYFQTFYVKFNNPLTGEIEERVFVGKAMFTPAEIKQMKTEQTEVEFIESFFTPPELNAYSDPDNEKAQTILTNAMRESLDHIEKNRPKKNDEDNLPS